MTSSPIITGEYNAESYRVLKDGNEIYCAGNSARDSQVYVSARQGVGLRRMKQFCLSTCEEMARELGAEFSGVEKSDS